MITKQCPVCKRILPATLDNFTKSKCGKHGLQSRCKECRSIAKKQYNSTHRESVREGIKNYYKQNKEKIIEWNKQYAEERKGELKQYREDRKEHFKRKRIQYKMENPDYNRLNCQRRRTRKNNLECTLTNEQWNECKKCFLNECCYCGKKDQLTQEHFIPLSKRGALTAYNIIPACSKCNSSKKDKDFYEWYHKTSFYSKNKEEKILRYINSHAAESSKLPCEETG